MLKGSDAVFRRLALLAGAEIMKIYAQEDLGAQKKADESPVTLADLAADKVIYEGLRAAFPDIPIVTEERAASHDAGSNPRFFLVDPLDGTKEFIKRGGDFTVNIALIENGAPTAGVVYAPAKGRLFQTLEAGGAVSETDPSGDEPGAQTPLKVTAPDNSALTVVASASHRDQATDDYIARYSVSAFRPAGSSLKFCLLAAGEADLYPRLGRTMEWDTAAGHAVLAAAGGEVVRADDVSVPLSYGKPGAENPFFIAYAPGVELK